MNRITDVHIHIQPWRDLKPKVQEAMRKGKEDHWEVLISLMDDPRALLEVMDKSGVWRVGLVNYPSPDIMGFDDSTNTFAAKYAKANPERLIPYGGVHARYTRDPAGDVDRLIDQGIRLLKIHPPHQAFPANAYTDGLTALGEIYRRCEERGLPVMIHTGTSIFPGARSKYGNPMELDDVAIDFPDLQALKAAGVLSPPDGDCGPRAVGYRLAQSGSERPPSEHRSIPGPAAHEGAATGYPRNQRSGAFPRGVLNPCAKCLCCC